MDALVKNAADPKQTRHAERKGKDARARDLADVAEVLSTRAGRRFIWRLLGECGVFESPYSPRGDLTHQLIGRGDIGRFLLSEIDQAHPEAWITMQLEAREDKRRADEETTATRTPRASQYEPDEGDHSDA